MARPLPACLPVWSRTGDGGWRLATVDMISLDANRPGEKDWPAVGCSRQQQRSRWWGSERKDQGRANSPPLESCGAWGGAGCARSSPAERARSGQGQPAAEGGVGEAAGFVELSAWDTRSPCGRSLGPAAGRGRGRRRSRSSRGRSRGRARGKVKVKGRGCRAKGSGGSPGGCPHPPRPVTGGRGQRPPSACESPMRTVSAGAAAACGQCRGQRQSEQGSRSTAERLALPVLPATTRLELAVATWMPGRWMVARRFLCRATEVNCLSSCCSGPVASCPSASRSVCP